MEVVQVVQNGDELLNFLHTHHDIDLAVVDVGSGQIRPILSALRNNPRYASIPLLVDSTRLQENLSLAGVLPTFRAMACNRAEMRLLLQTYSHNSQSPEAGRLALL